MSPTHLTGPISGVTYEAHNDVAHYAAMWSAGFRSHPDAAVGAAVLVSLPNGWEGIGTVVKVYKNGARRVRGGNRAHNRSPRNLWHPKEPT